MRGSAYIMLKLGSHEKMQKDLVILKTVLIFVQTKNKNLLSRLASFLLSHRHKMLVLLIILVIYVCSNISKDKG